MAEKSTVRSVTYELLRSLGLTTVFGNPGSTEETFLQEFPGDFSYVLGLQEASVIAMADAFAQVTRRPRAMSVIFVPARRLSRRAASPPATAIATQSPLSR